MIADLDAFLADVARSAYGWPDSLRFTYEKTRELLADGVPGDLVECGVAAGCHPAVMARACIDAGEQRTIRLFDSFRGLPNGSAADVEWNRAHPSDGKGTLEPVGMCVNSTNDVIANLTRWVPEYRCSVNTSGWFFHPPATFALYPGWFQDTMPYARIAYESLHGHTDNGIALLRLDGDLYASTKVCLKYLWSLVSPGGAIVIDDWNLDGCRAAAVEFLRGEYGCDYWAAYSDGDVRLQGAEPSGGNPDAPLVRAITASGDVWWRVP